MKLRITPSLILAAAIAFSVAVCPMQATAQETSDLRPIRAEFASPTDRYPHNIMGRLPAHTDLLVALDPCPQCDAPPRTLAIRLSANLVFEDFAPRLLDLDSDGRPEIVVVESDQSKGSRLAVWDVVLEDGAPKLVRRATTDFIGTRFRWLAPIGAADFDGDGTIDLAYVEKPHLDKVLRIVRPDGNQLRRIASVTGVTNHAIGQEEVQSRIDLCAGVPTIFALDAQGEGIVSIQMTGGGPKVTRLGKTEGRHRLGKAALCTP